MPLEPFTHCQGQSGLSTPSSTFKYIYIQALSPVLVPFPIIKQTTVISKSLVLLLLNTFFYHHAP